jgi:hypothetical protein
MALVGQRTEYGSSIKFFNIRSSRSSAFVIRSAYSPIIQMRDALASGSSSSSKFEQSEGITPSKRCGNRRKISYASG